MIAMKLSCEFDKTLPKQNIVELQLMDLSNPVHSADIASSKSANGCHKPCEC